MRTLHRHVVRLLGGQPPTRTDLEDADRELHLLATQLETAVLDRATRNGDGFEGPRAYGVLHQFHIELTGAHASLGSANITRSCVRDELATAACRAFDLLLLLDRPAASSVK